MFVLPYSPRWLAKQGRTEEARSTLIRLHGGSKNASLDIVDAEIQQMVEQIEWGGFFERRRRQRLGILRGTPADLWQSART